MIFCTVEATFAQNGDPRPTRMFWKGDALNIIEVGRRWNDEGGRHMLVRAADNRVFELVYTGSAWQGEVVSQPPHNFA